MRANEVFEIFDSDVCGSMSVSSHGGSQYFVTFIDDYSRYTYVYLIIHNHEVLDKLKEFVNFITNVTGKANENTGDRKPSENIAI